MLSIGGSDNGLDLFVSEFDEVRIYNRALSGGDFSLANGGAIGRPATTPDPPARSPADVTATPANLVGYRNRAGQSLQFSVTGSTAGPVWGTNIYTDDSSVAAAAVHAGVVAPAKPPRLPSTFWGQS